MSGMRMAGAGLVMMVAAVGCSADDGWDLACMEGDLAISNEIHARWSDPNACTAHSDCVHVDRDVECPDEGTMLYGCPRVVHRDSTDEFTAMLEGVKSDLCPRIEPGCRGSPGCLATVPRCVDGVCTDLPESEVDGGPADAGPADGG